MIASLVAVWSFLFNMASNLILAFSNIVLALSNVLVEILRFLDNVIRTCGGVLQSFILSKPALIVTVILAVIHYGDKVIEPTERLCKFLGPVSLAHYFGYRLIMGIGDAIPAFAKELPKALKQ